jgi:hypothetical protein
MNNRTSYLLAAFLVGFAVFAIMRWVFRFGNTESVMFGFIAATAETSARYIIRFLSGNKKDRSV